MRRITAYIAACLVAAVFVGFALLIRFDSIDEVWQRDNGLTEIVSFIPVIALVIGAIMAIPSFAIIFAQNAKSPEMRSCMIFGGISGAVALGIVAYFSDRNEAINDGTETIRIAGTLALFVLAGIAAGATYWTIAERHKT